MIAWLLGILNSIEIANAQQPGTCQYKYSMGTRLPPLAMSVDYVQRTGPPTTFMRKICKSQDLRHCLIMDTHDDDATLLVLALEVYRRVATAGTACFTEKQAAVVVRTLTTIVNGEACKRRILQRRLKEHETVYGTFLLANASSNTKVNNAVFLKQYVKVNVWGNESRLVHLAECMRAVGFSDRESRPGKY